MDRPLHHWLLEKLSREIVEEYDRIQGELRGKPQNIQLSGYLAENVWARLLAEWLPPQYGFGFRRHLLYEQAVDGEKRSPEVDLVLFHPCYPKRLREEHEVLISGVIAAFSVKLTLNPAGLREGVKLAASLRRGIQPRIGEPIGDLVSPLIVGVLAQSHSQFGPEPEHKVDQLLWDTAATLDGAGAVPDGFGGFSTSGLDSHPRNELDFVCVADLNCWRRTVMILNKDIGVPWALDEEMYVAHWAHGKLLDGSSTGRVADPIAILVSDLWQKLAHRDRSLKAVADGFRMTDTAGQSGGSLQPKPLRSLIDDATYRAIFRQGGPLID